MQQIPISAFLCAVVVALKLTEIYTYLWYPRTRVRILISTLWKIYLSGKAKIEENETGNVKYKIILDRQAVG